MTTVVFATDSPEGRAALNWAIDNRSAAEDEHVHVVLGAGDAPGRPGYISPSRLEEFTATLAPLGAAHQVHREPADPAQLALELAEREKARVLVVGLPPRRPTMKMIPGATCSTFWPRLLAWSSGSSATTGTPFACSDYVQAVRHDPAAPGTGGVDGGSAPHLLTAMARRRAPRDATREHAVLHAEIRRLALAVWDGHRPLGTNRARLQTIVDEIVPG